MRAEEGFVGERFGWLESTLNSTYALLTVPVRKEMKIKSCHSTFS
jgi:hypothetical protein